MKNNFKLFNIKRHLLTYFWILASSSKLISGQQSSDVSLSLELIPKITIKGEIGKSVRVESSLSLNGPWTTWTNVLIGVESTVLVDLMAGSEMKYYRTVSGTSLGPEGFVWIPPGTFKTTSRFYLTSYFSATVMLTKGFWISDHEVTQSEYKTITGNNPSTVKGENLPVCDVTWIDAVDYCKRLTTWEQSAKKILLNQSYRLPTEAEWEYVATNGGKDEWGSFFSDLETITNSGWFAGLNSDNKINSVMQKKPNKFGIYDMFGNVLEWCADLFGQPLSGTLVDPTGATSHVTGSRVCIGHSSVSSSNADRWFLRSTSSMYGLGFRPVLSER